MLKSEKHLRDLRRGLTKNFSLDDLQVLASELEIEWLALPGEQKAMKSYSLVTELAENGRLADLFLLLAEEKPHINWRSMFAGAVCDEAVQKYIEHVSDLLSKQVLNGTETDKIVLEKVKKQTTAILEKVDGERKGSIFRFLRDSGLIEPDNILDPQISDLNEVNLRNTSLLGLNMAGAQLFGANLSKAKLVQVDFEGADLRRANLGGANLYGANLRQADLQCAHLWGANLYKADLSRANLCGARLSGANLWKANLWQADLHQVYLWGADLRDANLSEAKNVTEKQLSLAKTCKGAILPNGSRQME